MTGIDPSVVRAMPPMAIRLAGLALLAHLASGLPARAEPVQSRSSAGTIAPWKAIVAEASTRFRLPESWLEAVIVSESAGNPGAVSGKGAMGLMQLMPTTWKAMSAAQHLGYDPFDSRANVLAGAAYLRAMLDRYGDLASALAAYNSGPGRLDEWRQQHRSLPVETTDYVARIVLRLGLAGRTMDSTAGVLTAAARRLPPRDWRAAPLFQGAAFEGQKRSSPRGAMSVSPRGSRPLRPSFADIFVALSQRSMP